MNRETIIGLWSSLVLFGRSFGSFHL